MKPTHTPTPWNYRPCLDTGLTRPYEKFDIFHTTPPEYDNGYGINTGSKKVFIGVIRSQSNKITTEANAALIVRAVNNHQALIDALEAVYADWKAIADADQYRDKNIDDLVLAALKTAKGE